MKNVIFTDVGREVEFKPDLIFKEYLVMTESDIIEEFRNKKSLGISDCPACRYSEYTKAFDKFGFQYVECNNCQTVYMCPHPDDIHIRKHYLNSSSAQFWRDTLTKSTKKKRKEKIYYPRFQWIIGTGDEYLSGEKNVADFNSKDVNFVTELLNNNFINKKLIIDPYFDIDNITVDGDPKKHFLLSPDIKKSPEYKDTINIATAFEVIDYISDVDTFIGTIKDLLCKGGLCFITTISISGFDLQVLWENSRSIFPLDRINVFSQKGLKLLFKRHGFEMLEYSTPGILDFDIVKTELNNNPGLYIPRFVRTMLERDDEQLRQDFQNFLQINRLSSFVRIVLRKK